MLRLEQSWTPEGSEHGGFRFTLVNAGTDPLAPRLFCYSSMTRLKRDATATGGDLARSVADHVEIALTGTLPPGGSVEIAVDGLTHKPTNRTQGALAAWLELTDGAVATIEIGDLQPPAGTDAGPRKIWPKGDLTVPLAMTPWPARCDVAAFGAAVRFYPADGSDGAAFASLAALHRRLFPADPAPLSLTPVEEGRAVEVYHDAALPDGGYRLTFGDTVTLHHSDADGLRHGVLALAQMAHGALTDPRFQVPLKGAITDAPRFGWRGCHLDVARNFHGASTVTRLLDIMAWLKMNHLHWHLTDDEGWRLPSRAFPALNTVGATRRRGGPLFPHYADGPDGQSGFYSEEDVAAIRAHATALGITIMPELDLPGHVTALLASVQDLTDPDEPADSYRSIQGYPNNALNPALPRTYEVVSTLINEVAALFPDSPLHIGGDEVDEASWRQSPAAQRLAKDEGLSSTQALQAHFMRKAHAMVAGHGRLTGAWDEAADGGGVDRDGTLLFAWRSVEKTAELIEAGYDVVATPGQAYYLDMIEAPGWDEAGTSWAGAVSPQKTYTFEPSAGLPDGPGRLVGVQAGIWTEHLNSVARLNAILFPRLAAIAEAGWTNPKAKNWPRFAALSRLIPTL